ncbi:BZ3500_MvSof-1268-A1-R1_Chr2-3g05298 [Microbotryum saponariae]|uniref:BZ3500_MvSof-1268-A1-R1_Chr2-3g05298 protein n=1 Tax=Microbotryum saponariae TaxID=289078 RepID=A0A2X0N8F2_9BASI|nr:BZ3500_MvSof-1268-A1-R1_Chr2-3g05298 [Microbotryum saponariae]SDA01147.1 BZ3501_MvSof-1269-A2-R1_Chr2-2g04971 [Microbotryum saponariae]
MPPKLPKLPKCAICQTAAAGKYRCPIDDVDYCTVKCFKEHKEEGCTGSTKPATTEDAIKDGATADLTSTGTPTAKVEPDKKEPVPDPTPQEQVKHTLKLEADDRPRKKLKDLRWPPEPDASIFLDPLARDDVKPLRRREYEAIATSPTIRRLLLTQPSLIPTLSRLLAIPTEPSNSSYHNHSSHSLRAPPPPSARETSLRLLLDLPVTSAPTYYRPSGRTVGGEYRTGSHVSQQGRKGNAFERADLLGGGAATGLVYSTPEERKEVQAFVDEVEKLLNDVRKDGGF